MQHISSTIDSVIFYTMNFIVDYDVIISSIIKILLIVLIFHVLTSYNWKFFKVLHFNSIKLYKINEPVNHLFWDEIHTNELGSLYISEIIYPELKKIIIKNK